MGVVSFSTAFTVVKDPGSRLIFEPEFEFEMLEKDADILLACVNPRRRIDMHMPDSLPCPAMPGSGHDFANLISKRFRREESAGNALDDLTGLIRKKMPRQAAAAGATRFTAEHSDAQ